MRLSRAPKSGQLPESTADAPLPMPATGTVGDSNSRKRRANASRSLADSAFNCSISSVTLIRDNYNVYPRETSRNGPLSKNGGFLIETARAIKPRQRYGERQARCARPLGLFRAAQLQIADCRLQIGRRR